MRVHRRNAWWQDAALVVGLCALIAGGLDARGTRAAETMVSNLDLMSDLTAQVVGELYGKFQGSLDGRPVRLKPASSGEEYVFVGNVFTTEMSTRGVKVIPVQTMVLQTSSAPNPVTGQVTPPGVGATAAPAAADGEELVLEYQTIAFELKYPDTYRSYWIGGKNVLRRADVRVLATLTDGRNGSVLWVGEAAREHTDEFSAGDASAVEEGTYAFAHPPVPSGSWTRFAEPVFVTGIIVGLVYLFFSNQSDN